MSPTARRTSSNSSYLVVLYFYNLYLWERDLSTTLTGNVNKNLPNMAYRAYIASFRIESDVNDSRKITSGDAETSMYHNNPNSLGSKRSRRLISIDNR